MDEPLLNLDTLIVRQSIAIDGARYALFNPDELSVMDSHRFSIWGRRIETLSMVDDVAVGIELDELYDQVASAALVDVPAAVFEKLTGSQKIAIVDVFTGLLLRRKLGVAGAMATAMGNRSTGASPFPDFSASTADRPAGGFMKRLLRWFART